MINRIRGRWVAGHGENLALQALVSLGTMELQRSEARAGREQAVLFIMEGMRSIGRFLKKPVMILRCFVNDARALL